MTQTAGNATDPFVGKTLSRRHFTVDAPVLGDYHAGLDLTPRPDGRAPSTIASGPDNGFFDEIAFPNHVGHLWMRQQWRLGGALVPDQRYAVDGRIADIYERRDRTVVAYEVVLRDPAGAVALTTCHHQSFLRDRGHTGAVSFRAPESKSGARRFEIPEGTPFGGTARTITLEMCGRFFHGNASYHTDRAASAELGFQDVVVGGRMTMALGAHDLERHFGDAWWQSGEFDLKFTNPVWPGDTITVNGVDMGADPDDAGRTRAFVWLTRADQTTIAVMHASVGV